MQISYRYRKISICFDTISYRKISISIFKFRYISKKYRYRFSSFDIYRKNIDIDFQVSIYIGKISISIFKFRYISKKYRYRFSGFDIYRNYIDFYKFEKNSKYIFVWKTLLFKISFQNTSLNCCSCCQNLKLCGPIQL